LHLPGSDLEVGLTPRGYRLLGKVPRLPDSVIDNLVGRFATLQKVLRASVEDLDEVKDVGATRARAIKDGLARLAESSILERYS
jgi:diadenylate cyclase